MQVLTVSEIDQCSGAYDVSAFGYTLSNGGNNANSWYQAGVWATGGAIAGSLGGWAGAGLGALGGGLAGFAGSFSFYS